MVKTSHKILFCSILLCGIHCQKDLQINSKTEILISSYWRIITFIDHSDNKSLQIPDSYYEFREEGVFVVYPVNQEAQYSYWRLLDKETYLRIGSNIYKIRTLTKKVMILEYGTIDIAYVPCNY